MKQYFLAAAVISLGLMSCKKSEVNVETVENGDGTVTTTTTETERTTTLDSVSINTTVDNAKEKLDVVAKDAGQTLKQAGEDVKDATARGAEKVENGAEKIKEDLNNK